MNQQVATQNQSNVPALGGNTVTEDVLRSDIVLPSILLMQGLSEFVKERKAQSGDIVRSKPFQLLGGPDKPLDFIPITFTNGWRIGEIVGGREEFRGREARNSGNEDLPWEFEKNGAKWKRTKTINLYALLPADIEAELAEKARCEKDGEIFDLDKTLMPVAIEFRSTGYNAGKAISTHFQKAKMHNALPYNYVLRLSCSAESNAKGDYYVYDVVTSPEKLKKDYMPLTAQWAETLRTAKVEIHEEEPIAAAPQGTKPPAKDPRF